MEPTDLELSLKKKVTGKTTIDHRARLDLKLSLEEYVLLDFIHGHNQSNKDPIKYSDYYRGSGLFKDDIKPLFVSLKEKGLLVFDSKENRVDVGQAWKDLFSTDGFIDKLWKMHPKGNKPTAKARLPKVLKIISIEELTSKLSAYIKHCDTNGTFKKGLEVWLNPVKHHWDDPLVANPTKTASGPQRIQKIEVKYK